MTDDKLYSLSDEELERAFLDAKENEQYSDVDEPVTESTDTYEEEDIEICNFSEGEPILEGTLLRSFVFNDSSSEPIEVPLTSDINALAPDFLPSNVLPTKEPLNVVVSIFIKVRSIQIPSDDFIIYSDGYDIFTSAPHNALNRNSYDSVVPLSV